MSGNEERRPVLRGFQHPDHENGRTYLMDPAGAPDADPTKELCSIWTGPIPAGCEWWIEDVPEFTYLDGDGRERTRHLRVGGDGAGPLVGEPIKEEEPASPPAQSANKDVWVDWAITQGADPETANAASKNDLIAQYGDHTGGN